MSVYVVVEIPESEYAGLTTQEAFNDLLEFDQAVLKIGDAEYDVRVTRLTQRAL